MANKIEQIASKKKAAQEKQDADVARFAKKVASEVALGLSDSALIGSIAELATSVAEAVVNSNQNLDVSLKDNFSKLLSAVKDNPSNANQIELSKTIGTSLANVEQASVTPLAKFNMSGVSGEYALLLAKPAPDGTVSIVGVLSDINEAFYNACLVKMARVKAADNAESLALSKEGTDLLAGGGSAAANDSVAIKEVLAA